MDGLSVGTATDSSQISQLFWNQTIFESIPAFSLIQGQFQRNAFLYHILNHTGLKYFVFPACADIMLIIISYLLIVIFQSLLQKYIYKNHLLHTQISTRYQELG